MSVLRSKPSRASKNWSKFSIYRAISVVVLAHCHSTHMRFFVVFAPLHHEPSSIDSLSRRLCRSCISAMFRTGSMTLTFYWDALRPEVHCGSMVGCTQRLDADVDLVLRVTMHVVEPLGFHDTQNPHREWLSIEAEVPGESLVDLGLSPSGCRGDGTDCEPARVQLSEP